MDAPLWAWLAVVAAIAALLSTDLLAHRRAHVIGAREAMGWSLVWITVGLGFGVLVWMWQGGEYAQQYYAGYLIEKSLAVDNVFVWALVFAQFAVPRALQHRVLFLGVVGALVLRGLFIAAGALLIQRFGWVMYVFAAFLVWTGIRMLRHRRQHRDPTASALVQRLGRLVPVAERYHGAKFTVRDGGRLVMTPLLLVLVVVELTDLLFAVDSIPAVFAVTREPFLVFTANAFAILGLRAMYFLLADLMHRFVHLKTGLAVVMVYVGAKMALGVDAVHVPTAWSLAAVVGILAVSVVTSLRASGPRPSGHPGTGHDGGGTPRTASPDREVVAR